MRVNTEIQPERKLIVNGLPRQGRDVRPSANAETSESRASLNFMLSFLVYITNHRPSSSPQCRKQQSSLSPAHLSAHSASLPLSTIRKRQRKQYVPTLSLLRVSGRLSRIDRSNSLDVLGYYTAADKDNPGDARRRHPVSYTHLTLPTKRIV